MRTWSTPSAPPRCSPPTPAAVDIGNTRPLVPLQIDPPHHSKHRKALDPLFAPKQMVKYEPRVRELIRELINKVADQGHCNFHDAIADPLPSTIFLELLGLPVGRVHEFLALKDGIIRPPARSMEERREMVAATGQKIYAALEEVVDARMAERQDDFLSTILDAEVDGQPLTRDDVVDIGYLFFLAGLDTVSASLECIVAFLAQEPRPPPAPGGRARHDSPRHRGAAPLREPGGQLGPHHRGRHRVERLPHRGRHSHPTPYRLGQHRRAGLGQPRRGGLRPGSPKSTSPSVPASTDAWAPTWLAWSCG